MLFRPLGAGWRRRCAAISSAALVSAVALTPVQPAAGQTQKTTLVAAYDNTVNSLDPVNADYAEANEIEQTLYDPLVTYDTNNQLVGRLASAFALSSDASSINITLRSDATFHDGTPVTAKDVAYTLDRTTRLGKGVAQFVRGYNSTMVTDDTHLTIQLSQPNSLFLGGLSKIFILNSALAQQQAGSDDSQGYLSNNDAGSGPYQLSQVQQGGDVTVTRYDPYWDVATGRPETIVYRLMEETATQTDELLAGNLDVTTRISPQDASQLQNAPGVVLLPSRDRDQAYVFFNMISGPTTNPAVRKAIQLAFDYNGAIDKIYNGQAEVANGPLPTTMACHPDLPKYQQNLDEARQTLADAGISNLSLTMDFQPAFANHQQAAVLLQSNLKEIGVNLDLTPISFPDWLARLSDPSQIPQMMMLEDFAQFPDPGVMLVPYYMSTSIGSNRSGYANPQVDSLLNQALASANPDQQCGFYDQAQRLIYNDAVAVNMYTIVDTYAYNSSLSGVHVATTASGPYIPDIRVQ